MISVEKFTYTTTLALSMGYYTMVLRMLLRNYCVIVLSCGLYEYTVLPMGLTISSNVFQLSMGGLFCDLVMVYVYVDNIIVLGSDNFEAHMKDVENMLWRLDGMVMQVNTRKTYWAVDKVDYHGFTITREGI